jgi:hypothetical protein
VYNCPAVTRRLGCHLEERYRDSSFAVSVQLTEELTASSEKAVVSLERSQSIG